MSQLTILICLIITFLNFTSYATTLQSGPGEVLAEENNPQFVEIFRIKIENKVDGAVQVSTDEGKSWRVLGKVRYPTNQVSNIGYTASRWVAEGSVAAVAVNAIHIKTDYNFADDKGVLFSIMPIELLSPPKYYNSYLSPDSSIYTDIKGGEGIFGGGFSPFVGNTVSTVDAGGKLYPLQLGFIPKIGDTFIIKVEKPVKYPKEIVFENRFGGLITLKYLDGEKKIIGEVLRPVLGVGRFQGTQFADVGRIRANHTGVIDVSTSPLLECGGFQIIPAMHGMSKEMINARTLTQWMVIGPAKITDPSLEGVAPFFQYFIRPNYKKEDFDDPDWQKAFLQRFLVEVKYKGDDIWHPMKRISLDPDLEKPLPSWTGRALEDVSFIRILFPIYKD